MTSNKLITMLWFDGDAREAAEFYARTFPDSHVGSTMKSPTDTPSGPAGQELLVEFTVCGQSFAGLNGGPNFKPNESVSFMIVTEDQAAAKRSMEAMMKMHRIDIATIAAAVKGIPANA